MLPLAQFPPSPLKIQKGTDPVERRTTVCKHLYSRMLQFLLFFYKFLYCHGSLQYGVVSEVDSKLNIHYIRTHWTGARSFPKARVKEVIL